MGCSSSKRVSETARRPVENRQNIDSEKNPTPGDLNENPTKSEAAVISTQEKIGTTGDLNENPNDKAAVISTVDNLKSEENSKTPEEVVDSKILKKQQKKVKKTKSEEDSKAPEEVVDGKTLEKEIQILAEKLQEGMNRKRIEQSLQAPKKRKGSQTRPRMDLASNFVTKCQIGNPNIDTSNVVFIPKEVFLQMGKITKYEDCSDKHVKVNELTQKNNLLFVSHRWQDALNNCPDDEANTQYLLIVSFLSSLAGAEITHIWVDYSCITQDKVNSLGNFLKQLDNIQTAIFLCDVVLVVPRVEHASHSTVCGYTDLREINNRGWCLFEALTALLAHCRIYVTFLCGTISTVQFFVVGGGVPAGKELTLETLKRGLKKEFREVRSYAPVKESAISSFFDSSNGSEEDLDLNPKTVRENWEQARNPVDLIEGLSTALNNNIASKAISLTLSITDSEGERIAKLLPDFSYDSDRSIVTNLLANVAGFVSGKFSKMQQKTDLQVSELSQKSSERWDLDLAKQHLFAIDLENIFKHKGTISKAYSLSLSGNSLGFNGANVLVRAGSFDKVMVLSLGNNGLGDAGATTLARALATSGNVLTTLHLNKNSLGNQSGKMLANMLQNNSTLTTLNLWDNELCGDGCSALAEALATNTTLKMLSLGLNQLTSAAACKVADSLALNTGLSTLFLVNNNLDKKCGEALATSLAMNSTLTKLYVSCNDLGESRRAIKAAWAPRQRGLHGLWI